MTLVRVEVAEWVATVTLDRPDVHNAFDASLIAELRATFVALSREGPMDLRAVVLAGNGPSFCAGADGDAVADPLDAGPLSPKPSVNTTIGPSGDWPIAGCDDGPRSRSALKICEPSSPSKPKTAVGATTTIVPSAATTGEDSPPVTSAPSSLMSSLVHATANGADGPSETPLCSPPPWNWTQSASAASGAPRTIATVTEATAIERCDVRERWERRKAASS